MRGRYLTACAALSSRLHSFLFLAVQSYLGPDAATLEVNPLVSPSGAPPAMLSKFPRTRIMAPELDVCFGVCVCLSLSLSVFVACALVCGCFDDAMIMSR